MIILVQIYSFKKWRFWIGSGVSHCRFFREKKIAESWENLECSNYPKEKYYFHRLQSEQKTEHINL